jgi:hypothetical protein
MRTDTVLTFALFLCLGSCAYFAKPSYADVNAELQNSMYQLYQSCDCGNKAVKQKELLESKPRKIEEPGTLTEVLSVFFVWILIIGIYQFCKRNENKTLNKRK